MDGPTAVRRKSDIELTRNDVKQAIRDFLGLFPSRLSAFRGLKGKHLARTSLVQH